jgi:hypothetical protein
MRVLSLTVLHWRVQHSNMLDLTPPEMDVAKATTHAGQLK